MSNIILHGPEHRRPAATLSAVLTAGALALGVAGLANAEGPAKPSPSAERPAPYTPKQAEQEAIGMITEGASPGAMDIVLVLKKGAVLRYAPHTKAGRDVVASGQVIRIDRPISYHDRKGQPWLVVVGGSTGQDPATRRMAPATTYWVEGSVLADSKKSAMYTYPGKSSSSALPIAVDGLGQIRITSNTKNPTRVATFGYLSASEFNAKRRTERLKPVDN